MPPPHENRSTKFKLIPILHLVLRLLLPPYITDGRRNGNGKVCAWTYLTKRNGARSWPAYGTGTRARSSACDATCTPAVFGSGCIGRTCPAALTWCSRQDAWLSSSTGVSGISIPIARRRSFRSRGRTSGERSCKEMRVAMRGSLRNYRRKAGHHSRYGNARLERLAYCDSRRP